MRKSTAYVFEVELAGPVLSGPEACDDVACVDVSGPAGPEGPFVAWVEVACVVVST